MDILRPEIACNLIFNDKLFLIIDIDLKGLAIGKQAVHCSVADC